MKEQELPEAKDEQEKQEDPKDSLKQKVWDYILTVGWLAQMDPTYPHTEFHPYEQAAPMPEPQPEPKAN